MADKTAPSRSPEERSAFGKSRREVVHRVDQCRWEDRPAGVSPVELILASTAGRLHAKLLDAIRKGRVGAESGASHP